MNILPKQYKQFLDKEYWDKFFEQMKQKPGQQFFQWYGSYSDLKKALEKLIHPSNHVLNIGCGKSLLSEQIAVNIGCNIISCDYSEKVIQEMQQRPISQSKGLKYQVSDVFNMQYQDNIFDIVLDKGTLDAVYPEDTQQNKTRIQTKMFTKILSLLKQQDGSKYLIVSMLQQHILKLIFQYFLSINNWNISVFEQAIQSQSLHPWVISIEYSKQSRKQIYLHLLNGDLIKGSSEEIEKQIKNIQVQSRFAARMHVLSQDQKFSLNIYDKNRDVRFNIDVIDSPVVKILNKNKCGVFIAPQGKQMTFLYGTENGINKLMEQVAMSRLILVKLVSGNIYDSLESTKKQLNSIIPRLLPKGCNIKEVPYMTDSDELGQREYVYKDKQYIVEDVKIDDYYLRRLIINQNRGMIQSQYRLSYFNQKNPLKQHLKTLQNQKTIMPKKKGTLIGLDFQEAAQGYERAVLGGLMLLPDQIIQTSKVLNLGGGGCVIPNFLANAFKQIDITVVQIDKKVIELAKQYFQVIQSDRYKLICEDGLKYVHTAKQKKLQFDIIIFDINGSEGQPSPAPIFLSQQFLQNLKQILSPNGLLIFHLIHNQPPPIFKTLFNPIFHWNDDQVDVLYCFNKQLVKGLDPDSKKEIIISKNQKINHPKSKKRWGCQQESFDGIKLLWPASAQIFIEEDTLNNEQKADTDKVNKKKKKKK